MIELLIACCAAFAGPEWTATLFDDGPPAVAVAARQVVDGAERTRISELLARQDAAIVARDTATAAAGFAARFEARDYRCKSAAELLARFDAFVQANDGVAFSSKLLEAERVGGYLVADVQRTVTATCRESGEPFEESSCETIVFDARGSDLLICGLFENESGKAARIDRARRRYDAGAELLYGVALPEPFVPVPRAPPGAALDDLLLIDPAHDTQLGLMLFEPTLDQELDEQLFSDLASPTAKFLLEPTRFERAPPAIGKALVAEVEYAPGKDEPADALPYRERAIYLSPDGRMIFAAWLRAPAAQFEAMKGKVDQLARSLRLADVRPGRSYANALLEANPRWKTVTEGIFRPEAAPIDLLIPAGLVATPLLGDHIVRLRLRLLDDPRSNIVVRVFPSGEGRISAQSILEKSVRRMEQYACAEGASGDSKREEGLVEVLGAQGDWRGVEIRCQDGSRRSYQIVALDHADCHVQVQVLPGSGQHELQSTALRKVLDGLCVRVEAPPANAAERDR